MEDWEQEKDHTDANRSFIISTKAHLDWNRKLKSDEKKIEKKGKKSVDSSFFYLVFVMWRNWRQPECLRVCVHVHH